MLNIKDINIDFEKKVDIKNYKGVLSQFYYGELSYNPKECTCCGEANINHQIIKMGKKKSRITLPHISEYPAYLLLKKQRFYCKSCAQYFTAETPVVNKYCFISNNSRLAILHKAQDICSESSIASSYSVSPVTVSRFIDEAAESIQLSPDSSLPEHILMDEFKSVKNVSGSMSFIYVDALTHRIIDIVENRRLRSLKDYFYRFSLNDRQRVQTVTIDMYEPYMNLIKEVFPNAKIIIDRFHIVQALNRALNMARVTAMNTFRSINRPLYNKYKRYWKLLLAPQETLELFEYRKVALFKSWKTEKGIIDYILEQDPVLKNTYSVVNQLRYYIKNNDISSLKAYLEEVQLSMVYPKLQTVIRTFKKYILMIENTIEYKNITNGPIEGINNKIKLIKRVSFGYRNYNHLRNRIILCSRLYASTTKKEVKQSEIA